MPFSSSLVDSQTAAKVLWSRNLTTQNWQNLNRITVYLVWNKYNTRNSTFISFIRGSIYINNTWRNLSVCIPSHLNGTCSAGVEPHRGMHVKSGVFAHEHLFLQPTMTNHSWATAKWRGHSADWMTNVHTVQSQPVYWHLSSGDAKSRR